MGLLDTAIFGKHRDYGGAHFDVTHPLFGAVGDGTTDNYAAIQLAITKCSTVGGGRVYVPGVDVDDGEYYRISQKLQMRDNVTVYGDGRASEIRNDHTTPESLSLGPVFQFGWFYEGYWDDIVTTYAINDVTSGDSTITFDTSGDSANFAAGDLVVIRSSAVTSSDEPLEQHVTEVESVGSGTFVMRDPAGWDITDPTIWNVTQYQPASGDVYAEPVHLVRHAVVEDIAVRCNYFWMMRSGMYKCRISNVHVLSSGDMFNANLDNGSVIENVSGYFNMGVVETVSCMNTTIRGINASWVANADNPNTTNLQEPIAIGAVSRHVTFEDFHLDCGAYDPASTNYVMRIQGQDITIRNGLVRWPNVAVAIDIRNAFSASAFHERTRIENVTLDLTGSTLTRWIRTGQGAGGFDITGLQIRDCTFIGPAGSADAMSLDEITGAWLENIDFQGSSGGIATFTADAHDNHLINIRGLTSYTGAGAALNWIRPPAGTPGEVVTFGSGDATPSVKYGTHFITAGSTTITAFDDAVIGQTFVVQFGASPPNVDFTGTTLKGNGGVDLTDAADGDWMVCHPNGTNVLCEIHRAS